MKLKLVLNALSLLLTFSFAMAQETRMEGQYGIDHEKGIVVATGRLPKDANLSKTLSK